MIQWIIHFNNPDNDIPASLRASIDDATEEFTVSSETFRRETGPPSMPAAMREEVEVTEKTIRDEEDDDLVRKELLQENPISSLLDYRNPLSLHSQSPIDTGRVLPEFDQILLNATLLGRAKLLQLALKAEAKRMLLIKRKAQVRIDALNHEVSEIENMMEMFESYGKELDETISGFRTARSDHARAHLNVAKYEGDPIFQAVARDYRTSSQPSVTPFLPRRVNQFQTSSTPLLSSLNQRYYPWLLHPLI